MIHRLSNLFKSCVFFSFFSLFSWFLPACSVLIYFQCTACSLNSPKSSAKWRTVICHKTQLINRWKARKHVRYVRVIVLFICYRSQYVSYNDIALIYRPGNPTCEWLIPNCYTHHRNANLQLRRLDKLAHA